MKNIKRILNVKVIREVDMDPDTSYLGEYSNRPTSEYSIDRAHSEDCASVSEDIRKAKETLEHVQQTIGDFHNAVLAQYNGTLANEKLDSERDALDEAYNQVGELFDSIDECDCRKHYDSREYRYFNPSFNYVDKHGKPEEGNTPEDIRKYTRQDYDRMERLNRGDWCYIGIHAEAKIAIENTRATNLGDGVPYFDSTIQHIRSGGLWGIESDSDKSYFAEVEAEQLSELRTQLKAIGFSTRAISAAFKNIGHIDD